MSKGGLLFWFGVMLFGAAVNVVAYIYLGQLLLNLFAAIFCGGTALLDLVLLARSDP